MRDPPSDEDPGEVAFGSMAEPMSDGVTPGAQGGGLPEDHPLSAYFRSMRQILSSQEQVMSAFLGARGQTDLKPLPLHQHRAASPVWITGIGMVTPLGIGWRENWANLCQGISGIHAARGFDPEGLATRFAGEVPPHFKAHYDKACPLPFPERHARFTRFGVLSAAQALEDAGLDLECEDRSRIGIAVGVGAGAFNYLLPVDQELKRQGQGIWPALDHNYVVKHMHNAVAAQISIWKDIQGPTTTVAAACASGAQAIGTAIDWIRNGRADVVLAGGADSTVNRFVIHAYNQILALSRRNDEPEKASRPFDRHRDGFVMSEGAAIMVLESEQHARRRGARRYAAFLGHASSSDAHNVVKPRPGGAGMAGTMRLALADAGLGPEAIDYISAHGTSTRLNDSNETKAIRSVFGADADRLAVSSQKSMLGHAIGASSAIEAAITALIIRNGVLTPTINLEQRDPECDLDYVPNQAREARVRCALSNAFGFGGHNCCLVLSA